MIEDENLQLKNKFIKAYRNNNANFSKAADAINRSRAAVYIWIDKDPSFKELIAEADEALLDDAEEKLQILIKQENLNAIKFFLETKGKGRGYDTRAQNQVNLTLKDLTKPKEVDIEELGKDDILNLRDIIRKSKKDKTA